MVFSIEGLESPELAAENAFELVAGYGSTRRSRPVATKPPAIVASTTQPTATPAAKRNNCEFLMICRCSAALDSTAARSLLPCSSARLGERLVSPELAGNLGVATNS